MATGLGRGRPMVISGFGSTRSAIERSTDPQPASSRAFPPRTSAAERRTSATANGFLRICPPVLEAAEPGEKDGGGCQGEHEASERSCEERARRACGVDEGLHPERP